MPQVPLEWSLFRGLQPGIDRKRVPDAYVVEGENFLVDVDGPVSIFGKRWQIFDSIEEPRGIQALDDGPEEDLYWCLHDSINVWEPATRQLVPVFEHPQRVEWWPWTRARVGTFIYLCNKEIGLIRYCTTACLWQAVTGSNVPPDPIAVCESGGRLVILSNEFITWSAIDDGSNAGLAPSTATGAGFQSLSIISSNPRALMVLPYSGGVISYARAGVLRSELRETSPNPFRHRVISRTHPVLNPWCAIVLPSVGDSEEPESHLFLTPRGFYTTDGRERPKMWQPLLSEYFHRQVLPRLQHADFNRMSVRLGRLFQDNAVTVSVSEDSRSAIYTHAWVVYTPTGDVGNYAQGHTAFVPFIKDGEYESGVVDVNGIMWSFTFTAFDLAYPAETLWTVDFRLPTESWPAIFRGISAESLLGTHMTLMTESPENFVTAAVYNTRTTVFRGESPAVLDTPYEAAIGDTASVWFTDINRVARAVDEGVPQPLNASILVGPLKLPGAEPLPAVDTLLQTQSIIVGMLEGGIADEIRDYLTTDTDVIEDWNVLDGQEDWGQLAGDVTNYTVHLQGTLDGYRVWQVDGVPQEISPELAKSEGRTQHMVGVVAGQYLFLRVTTDVLGESFHLKHLKASVTSAGRVF